MSYLCLGSSGKVLKKKKKEKDGKGKTSAIPNEYDDDEKVLKPEILKNQTNREILPPPPPRKNLTDSREKRGPTIARAEEDDIVVGDGIGYAIPSKDMSQSSISEDMKESPRSKERTSYFSGPAYGPVPPSEPSSDWQQTNGYDAMQAQELAANMPSNWLILNNILSKAFRPMMCKQD